MKCFLCKGDLIPSTTAYMTTHNDCFIIIKNVPCLKCDQCGEEYIDGSTLMKIESIIEKFRFVLTEIAIVDFSNAA
jgi:YgiT-type zinc finger domain-containing protein